MGTISGRTQALSVRDSLMASMRTSSLEVHTVAPAELLTAYVKRAFSKLEEVERIGQVVVGLSPPVGVLTLAEPPCGRLSKRDMYHAMRTTSLEPPKVSALDAPLSCCDSRIVFRRAPQMLFSEAAS